MNDASGVMSSVISKLAAWCETLGFVTRRICRFTLCLMLSVVPGVNAVAQPPSDLDQLIEKTISDIGVPGLAIAIVEGDNVVYSKGHGVLALNGSDPVTADTNFQIGSVSKAFTSAAAAILVDEGRFSWETPIIDISERYHFRNSPNSTEITLVDLLSHRSGLGYGSGDLLILPGTDFTVSEIVDSAMDMQFESEFRSKFAYNNIGYVVAGAAIEELSELSFKSFVADKVFAPLNMRNTGFIGDDVQFASYASAHSRLGPPFKSTGMQQSLPRTSSLGANVTAAGGILSNANDMSKWILDLLKSGPDGGSYKYLFDIHTPFPGSDNTDENSQDNPPKTGYGLGWYINEYNGHRVILHAGGTLGYLSVVALLPDLNVGFVILQNSEDDEAIFSLRNTLVDHYSGADVKDWLSVLSDSKKARTEKAKIEHQQRLALKDRIEPSLELSKYTGSYTDEIYGVVSLFLQREDSDKNVLRMTFPRSQGMSSVLKHHEGNTFVAEWDDPVIEPAFVTFEVDDSGGVRGIKLGAISPLADFSFDYGRLDLKKI